MEVFIGTVMPFPYNFVPQRWMACNGQLLPISQYSALFSLIGTYYGGNGQTNFALPHLNTTSGEPTQVAAGQGNGPGLTPRFVGEAFGSDGVTLTSAEIPPHVHTMSLYGGIANRTAVPVSGGGMVDPTYGGFVSPTPTPAMTRPPERTSSVESIFAARIGFRWGRIITLTPSLTRSVQAAR